MGETLSGSGGDMSPVSHLGFPTLFVAHSHVDDDWFLYIPTCARNSVRNVFVREHSLYMRPQVFMVSWLLIDWSQVCLVCRLSEREWKTVTPPATHTHTHTHTAGRENRTGRGREDDDTENKHKKWTEKTPDHNTGVRDARVQTVYKI